MPFLLPIVVCLVTLANVPAQQPRMFDQWSKLPFADEKARLDNLAIFLTQNEPSWVVYLMFYDGKRACAGELQARALRAKKYLMKRGVTEDRIIWKRAGYRESFTVQVWTWRRDIGEPGVYTTVSPSDAHVVNCHAPRRLKRRV